MKTDNAVTPVMIRCPECKFIQAAIVEVVEEAPIWPIYVHYCTECDELITESEWEEIKPLKLDKT